MEEKKYSVDVLDSSKRKEGGGVKCGVYGNGTAGGNGDGEVWEMMFVVSPGKSEEEDKKVKKLSEEMGKRNVSSFYACGKHPWK